MLEKNSEVLFNVQFVFKKVFGLPPMPPENEKILKLYDLGIFFNII